MHVRKQRTATIEGESRREQWISERQRCTRGWYWEGYTPPPPPLDSHSKGRVASP